MESGQNFFCVVVFLLFVGTWGWLSPSPALLAKPPAGTWSPAQFLNGQGSGAEGRNLCLFSVGTNRQHSSLHGKEELGGLNPLLQICSSSQRHIRSPGGLTWAVAQTTRASYETHLFDSSRFYRKPIVEERAEWRSWYAITCRSSKVS